ncbi:hypothetical protein ACEWPM_019350 [Roseovarius sp. S4756]|uniref:hypothetical protein n=1 Tax=Roseovarius maritimus TaxID=3342637 RepID=UPI00372C9491
MQKVEYQLIFRIPRPIPLDDFTGCEEPIALFLRDVECTYVHYDHPTLLIEFEDKVRVNSSALSRQEFSKKVLGDSIITQLLKRAQKILLALPKGARLHEVRPHFVSLSDIAEAIGRYRRYVKDSNLLPPPNEHNLYDVLEIYDAFERSEFELESLKPWLEGGIRARVVNAWLTITWVDPETGKPTFL